MRQVWHLKPQKIGQNDDWLMTYADVITLLLCFFATFLAFSTAKKEGPLKTDFAVSVPFPVHVERHRIDSDKDSHVPHQDPDASRSPIVVGNTMSTIPANQSPADNSGHDAHFAETHAQLTDTARPEAIKPALGDRIIMLELDSAAFFSSGSADLNSAGRSILSKAANELKSDKFKDYQITVEGHTDDTPIHTKEFPSNWELSTARAAAVVHFFLDEGIPAQKLRASGYADTFPRVPNRNEYGDPIPENQAMNRRVVIKLEKIEKVDTSLQAPESREGSENRRDGAKLIFGLR